VSRASSRSDAGAEAVGVGSSALFGPAAPPTPGLPGPRWLWGAPSGGPPRDTHAALTSAHTGDAPGRVALAGAAAPDPCAHGRRAGAGVRQSARCPRPLRTGETHTELHPGQGPVPPHHLRAREGHQWRPPRLPLASTHRRHAPAGNVLRAPDAWHGRRRPDGGRVDRLGNAATGHPSRGRDLRGRAMPVEGAPALMPCSPHARGAGHEAQTETPTARHGQATS